MPQVTLMGHPLHPQLIVLPAGLLPFSLLLDAMHAATRDQSYADAAYYTMMGGFSVESRQEQRERPIMARFHPTAGPRTLGACTG